MKFNPCVDQCTTEGSHCEGCGRSHREIAETKRLVKEVADFIRRQDYSNPEEFIGRFGKSIAKKLSKPE